jgi:hypothetical protein
LWLLGLVPGPAARVAHTFGPTLVPMQMMLSSLMMMMMTTMM